MSEDLNTEIKIGADASGVEVGVGKAKKSLASLGQAAEQVGKTGTDGFAKMGAGGEAAARNIDKATKNTIASLQRQIAAFEAGGTSTRRYQEELARMRGLDTNALKPYLDQLDAAKAKAEAAAKAQGGLRGAIDSVNEESAIAARAMGVLGVALSAAFSVGSIKSAADIADSLDDMAEKSGIAVRELSALRYAGEVVGTPLEALGTGIRKLGQNMAAAAGGAKEQAAAFASVGVSIKNADGSLRGQDQVLGDLATKFAGYTDGAEKSALAIELFGKQGEALIPLLNQGASGIAELRQEGERLGAVFGGVVAKQAADFNDNLTRMRLTAEGTRLAVASELLPTLNKLAEAFIETRDGSNSLATSLGTGVRTVIESSVVLYSDVVFVLKGIGREIGAIGAQFAALGRLDFDGFSAISDAVREDGKRAREELDKFQRDVLNARYLTSKAGAGRGTAPDPRSLGDTRDSAPIVKKPDAAGGSIKTEQAAYESLIASIRTKIETDKAELAGAGALTESRKLAIKMEEELATGKLKLTEGHKRQALAALEELAVVEQQKKAQAAMRAMDEERLQIAQEQAQAYVAESKAREAGRTAVNNYVRGIDESNDALQFELSIMGMGERARAVALDQYRIELDLKKQIAAIDANTGFDEVQREEQRARARAAAAIAMASASSRQFLQEWSGSVGQYEEIFRKGFADMLNEGKDGWKSFTKSLATTFKTTVADQLYKMFAQPIVVRLVGSMLGLVGMGAPGVAGGGNNLLGMLSNGASLYNAYSGLTSGQGVLGSIGSFFGLGQSAGTGLGLTSSGSGLGLSLGSNGLGLSASSPGASTFGANIGASLNAPAASSGSLMSSLASAAPYIAGALVVGNALGLFRSNRQVNQGIKGTLSYDSDLELFEQWRKGGTLFDGPKYSDKDKPMDLKTAAALDQSVRAVYDASEQYAVALGLTADGIRNITRDIRIETKDLSDEQVQQKLQAEFEALGESLAQNILGVGFNAAAYLAANPDVAASEKYRNNAEAHYNDWGRAEGRAPGVYETGYSDYSRSGEKAIDTLTRLATSLGTVNSVFESLGQTLYEASLKGGDMASQLVDRFGGIDKLTAATGRYFDLYYSEGERVAKATSALTKSFGDLGFALPANEAALRKLVEAQDLTTERGREVYAVLVGSLAEGFANLQKVTTDAAKAAEDAAQAERELIASRQGAARSAIGSLADSLAEMRGDVADAEARVADARMQIWQGYTDAQQRVIDLERQAADATRGFARSLRAYVSDLATGPQSSLGLESRYRLLQRQLQSTATLAGQGDQAARDSLTSIASNYLQAAADRSTSSVDYARESARVRVLLSNLATQAEADPLVKKYESENLSLQKQIANAQIDVVKYLALMEATGTSTTLGIQTVDKTLTQMRDGYVAALQAQAASNLKLDVALAALDALGLTEELVKAVAANQTSSIAASLNITDAALASITGALGLTPENMAAIGQEFAGEVALLLGNAATNLANTLDSALAFDPSKFDALRTVVGYDSTSPDFTALQTILGFDLESSKFQALQTILGFAPEADAQVSALMGGVRFTDDAAQRADALASGLQFSPSAQQYLDQAAAGVGFTADAQGQIELLGAGVGFATDAQQLIGVLGSGVAFTAEALGQMGVIAGGVAFAPDAAGGLSLIASGVGFAPDAQVQLGVLGAGVGFAADAQQLIGVLGSGVAFTPEALGQVGVIAGGVGFAPDAAGGLSLIASGVAFADLAQAQIQQLGAGVAFAPEALGQLGVIAGGVGFAPGAVGGLSLIASGLAFADLAQAQIQQLGAGVAFDAGAQQLIGQLAAGVDFTAAAQGQIGVLGTGVGFAQAAREQIALLAGGVGFAPGAAGGLSLLESGLSFASLAQAQIGQLAGGIGFAPGAQQQIGMLDTGVDFTAAAQQQIGQLSAGVQFAQTARDQINLLAAGVSLTSGTQAQAQGLIDGIGWRGDVSGQVQSLLTGLMLSPAASAQVDGLLSGLSLASADRALVQRMLGGIGFTADAADSLREGLGVQDGLLTTLSASLGLSPAAMEAIGVLSSVGTIDKTVRDAYALIGRTGIGSGINQIDQAGFDFWKSQLANGTVSQQQFVPEFLKAAAGSKDSAYLAYVAPYLKKLGIPGFAVGTNYVPQDMLAMVHKGEMIVPAAYNPAALGGAAPGANQDAVVKELQALRTALEAAQRELAAIRGSSATTAGGITGIVNRQVTLKTEAKA